MRNLTSFSFWLMTWESATFPVSMDGRSRTPNLDQLKSESIWFSQAYSASPVCAPARAALLTGRYPHRTGAVTLNMEKHPKLTRIRKEESTLADAFRANNYTTGLIGKWHSGIGPEYHPLRRGFDEFEGFYRASLRTELSRLQTRYPE